MGKFTRGLPQDAYLEYSYFCFFVSSKKNTQPKDHELFTVNEFLIVKKLMLILTYVEIHAYKQCMCAKYELDTVGVVYFVN